MRIFWKHSSEWIYIDPEFIFNATAIRAGLELGVDSRALVTDSYVWNGTVRVSFNAKEFNITKMDHVALKLAPVLLHHHLQPAQRLISVLGNDSTHEGQAPVHQGA